jgi:phasin family protein
MPVNRNEEIEKTADVGRKTADETTRTARAVTEEVTKAGEHAARAGVDIARRSAETVRDNMQSGINTAVQGFQRVTDQFRTSMGFVGPQAEELARRSSQNIEAVAEASTVLVRGLQEVSQQWFGFFQDRTTKNIDAMNRIAQCRSVQDLMALQSDLVRDNLQQAIETARRVGELSTRVAGEAAQTIQTRGSNNADRVRRAA